MNSVFKTVVSVLALAALGACIDDDGPIDYPKHAPLSQADVQDTVSMGLLIGRSTDSRVAPGLDSLGVALQELSFDSLGSRSTPPATCAVDGKGGGTYGGEVKKSSVHAGLEPGDQIVLVYAQCDVGDEGFLLNGTVTLTVQGAALNLPSDHYEVRFGLEATAFSMTFAGLTTRYDGVADVVSTVTGPGIVSTRFKVPVAKAFDAILSAASAASPTVHLTYAANTTFARTETATPNGASIKLDGLVDAGPAADDRLALVVGMPTALTGTSTAHVFAATSGVITAWDTGRNLATTTTFNGDKATVSADTDGDSSLDLVFDTTWAALTSP